MLYSAARDVEQAAAAFRQALTLDPMAHVPAWDGYNMAHAYGWDGDNKTFLGHAEETLPAIERAIRLHNPSAGEFSTWSFFGGFAELLLGRTEAAIALLNRSLQHNPTHTNSQFFLMAALLAAGRRGEADLMQASSAGTIPVSVQAFERLWLSRSVSPVYRAQEIHSLFANIWAPGTAS